MHTKIINWLSINEGSVIIILFVITIIFIITRLIWTPHDVSLYSYRIALVGIIVGAIALYFGYKQVNMQLSELNSKAKIELKIRVGAILMGDEVTKPIKIMIIPRNKGKYNTSTWEAGIIFCSSTNVLEYDKKWEKIDSKMFRYKSDDKIIFEQFVFFYENDSIGKFQITLDSNSLERKDQIIPLGIFSTGGEKAEQINTFVYLDLKQKENNNVVQYEPVLVNNDGKVLTDTKGCFPSLLPKII